jgi:hypothetical protein
MNGIIRFFYAALYARFSTVSSSSARRLYLKCDGTRAETRFLLSAKRTSPFKSAGASVQPTTGSRDVRICGSNAKYAMFRGSVKGTGYTLHSPVSPSLPHRASPCAITFQLDSTSRLHVCFNYENRFFNTLAHLTEYTHHILVAVIETTV